MLFPAYKKINNVFVTIALCIFIFCGHLMKEVVRLAYAKNSHWTQITKDPIKLEEDIQLLIYLPHLKLMQLWQF